MSWNRAAAAVSIAAVSALFTYAPAAADFPVPAFDQSTLDLWTAPAGPAESATIVLAYSFGNRIPAGVDPAREVGAPGPVNEELAAAVVAARGDRDIPVYAQTEIAEVLVSRYHLTDVVSIDPVRATDGTLVYLSTEGVAAKVAELRGPSMKSDAVAVVAFADHQWRATHTTIKQGFHAFAPAGVTMPSTYDPESGQAWTRSASVYRPNDLVSRLALLR
ncbi:hypothetical protein ACIO52_21780 [Nocardia sp. NPDC087230]|uniref:hypothetical protein n=1 Tax=Nocardia sp. NPDC087230 TaxID=3364331 RepID=UPI00382ED578